MTGGIDDIGDILDRLRAVAPAEASQPTDQIQQKETPITQADSIGEASQDTEKGPKFSEMPGVVNLENQVSRSDVEAFLFMINEVEVGIVNTILQVWSKGIEENKRLDKEQRELAIRQGLNQIGKFLSGISDSYVDETQRTEMSTANMTAFTMMAALTLGQVSAIPDPTMATAIHNLNPAVFNVVPVEMQGALAMTGALIASALTTPILLNLTGMAQSTEGKLPENALATQLAYVTSQFVNSGLARQLINNDSRFNSLGAEQKSELVAKMNLTYMLGALTLFYEKETGWITEEEIVDMLNQGALYQKIKGENPSDPRLSLIAMIRQELGSMSQAERKEFLREALKHFSDNPAYESSQELYGLLSKMWANMDYEQMSESAA